MPELRKDPIIGRWVIISTKRGKRPSDFGRTIEQRRGGFCPFCGGNEATTPPEVLAYRDPDTAPNTPGWTLRVVPNKFPALQIEGGLNKMGEGMFDKMNGIGAHEVLIETPEHEMTIPKMALKDVENMFWGFRDRILDLKKDPRFRYIMAFKNHGSAAGASLEHPHSQLIALPIVPLVVQAEMDGAKTYYNYKDRCVFCDIIYQEKTTGTRRISKMMILSSSVRMPLAFRSKPGFFQNTMLPCLRIVVKVSMQIWRKHLKTPLRGWIKFSRIHRIILLFTILHYMTIMMCHISLAY